MFSVTRRHAIPLAIPMVVLSVIAYSYANLNHAMNLLHIVEVPFDAEYEEVKPKKCSPALAPRPMRIRENLGILAEELGLKTGIEIGVQTGRFSKTTLKGWKSCESYHLIDPWTHQESYNDIANENNAKQETIMNRAKALLKDFENITTFHRMFSSEAVSNFEKDSIDYIYVDARHDYCGVMEDLVNYWPIVKPGGIMAGHDYMTNPEVQKYSKRIGVPLGDWGICGDGSRNEGAVKGAAEDFFTKKGLLISVAYVEDGLKSWMVQKPLCD